MDAFLAQGEYFWHMEDGSRLMFDAAEEIDWDQEAEIPWEELTDKERRVAESLARRGASFPQALGHVLDGESPTTPCCLCWKRDWYAPTALCRYGSG